VYVPAAERGRAVLPLLLPPLLLPLMLPAYGDVRVNADVAVYGERVVVYVPRLDVGRTEGDKTEDVGDISEDDGGLTVPENLLGEPGRER
jgi:hypothetical protein